MNSICELDMISYVNWKVIIIFQNPVVILQSSPLSQQFVLLCMTMSMYIIHV